MLQQKQTLAIKKLTQSATLPQKGSLEAAGYDLFSDCQLNISPGGRGLVKTGLAIAVPPGNYGRVAPRSGLSLKKGIQIGAGVIDSDYRGEVQPGDRVAQLIIEKITMTDLIEVSELDDTARGIGGFGSTGIDKFL